MINSIFTYITIINFIFILFFFKKWVETKLGQVILIWLRSYSKKLFVLKKFKFEIQE